MSLMYDQRNLTVSERFVITYYVIAIVVARPIFPLKVWSVVQKKKILCLKIIVLCVSLWKPSRL